MSSADIPFVEENDTPSKLQNVENSGSTAPQQTPGRAVKPARAAKSNRKSNRTEQAQDATNGESAATPPKRVRSKRVDPERFAQLEDAQDAVGDFLYSLLQKYGDTNPNIGMRAIIEALVDVGAPEDKLVDLAYLGQRRVRRFQDLGGQTPTGLPDFYIATMRSLAKEASRGSTKRKAWDVQSLEEQDRRKHERALAKKD